MPVTILDPSNSQHQAFVPTIVSAHMDCINNDLTESMFLPPLDRSKMTTYWQGRVTDAHRVVFITTDVPSPAELPGSPESKPDPTIAGLDPARVRSSASASDLSLAPDSMVATAVVVLYMSEAETGPMRGAVEKLLVSPFHRRKGLARSLMKALEQCAIQKGRTTLLLDTEKGSPAEGVYPKFGYVKMGEIPRFGESARTLMDRAAGKEEAEVYLVDEVWFWKDLKVHQLIQ